MLAFQFHIQNQAYLSDDSKKKSKTGQVTRWHNFKNFRTLETWHQKRLTNFLSEFLKVHKTFI